MLKNNRKGFTLLELMIVVAIIGVLAAVAVPGFMAYIKSSKTAEAKTNLDSVKKGAIAFFEAEHYSEDGLVAVTKQYPSAQAYLGPDTPVVGVKWDPSGELLEKLNAAPWRQLNFRISAPAYYSYGYAAVTVINEHGAINVSSVAGLKTKPNPASTFQAVACASLNESADSVFTLTGTASGSIGAPVEAQASEKKCPSAKAPEVKEGSKIGEIKKKS